MICWTERWQHERSEALTVININFSTLLDVTPYCLQLCSRRTQVLDSFDVRVTNIPPENLVVIYRTTDDRQRDDPHGVDEHVWRGAEQR